MLCYCILTSPSPTCCSTLIYYLCLSFPHLLALWQKVITQSNRQKDQSRKLSSVWQRAQKWAQSTTGTQSCITYVLPALPSCCWSITAGKGKLPSPSAPKQLIKLKASTQQTQSLCQEVFPGLADHPDPGMHPGFRRR